LLAQLFSTVGTVVKALRPIFVSTERTRVKQSCGGEGYADVEIGGVRNLTHFHAFQCRTLIWHSVGQ
jgi:hypothetical protein